MQPHFRRAVAGGLDPIGALVEHLEAHILEHRHALGQGDRPVAARHFQADRRALGAAPAGVELGTERARR